MMSFDSRNGFITGLCPAILLWTAFLFATDLAAAQAPAHDIQEWKLVRVDEKLNNIPILDIHQDRRGFVWIASQFGILKYDGKRLDDNPFGEADTLNLHNSYFRSIAEDNEGTLWLATASSGLIRFHPDSGNLASFRHDSDDSTTISSDNLEKVLIDRAGTLWIGAIGGSLDSFDPAGHQFLRHRYAPAPADNAASPYAIFNLIEEEAGTILATTSRNGLLRFDPKTGRFSHLPTAIASDQTDPLPFLLDIARTGSDSLWIGTLEHGLLTCASDADECTQHRFISTPEGIVEIKKVDALLPDERSLWFGTMQAGLLRYDFEENRYFQYLFNTALADQSQYEVISLVKDRSGFIWVGTAEGLFKAIPAKFHALPPINVETAPPDRIAVLPVIDDGEGTIWMGTDGHGLLAYDKQTGAYRQYRHTPNSPDGISNNRIFSLALDSSFLWIGTFGGGVNMMDTETRSITRYRHDPTDPNTVSDDRIWPLIKDRKDHLWIGAITRGIDHFNTTTRTFTHYGTEEGLSSELVSSLLEDRNGNIWAGTSNGGVNLLNPETGVITSYRHSSSDSTTLSSDRIFCLLEDTRGRLWVGTMDAGLNLFLPEENAFLHYREKDGLPSDHIVRIQEDNKGYLWLATDKGLSRFDPDNGLFTNYNTLDGLHGDSFRVGSPVKQEGDYLYFGGLGGVTYFSPDRVVNSDYNPPVRLTGIYLYGEPFQSDTPPYLAERISLKYNENTLDFTFASLDYSNPEKNRYRYYLEGWDSRWIDNDTSTVARYRSLAPGSYTFHVNGTNSEGIWSENTVSLAVHLAAPFYKRWWFITLSILFPASIIMTFVWYSFSKRMEIETIRYNIASELHDEIGANLSTIIIDSNSLADETPLSLEQKDTVANMQDALLDTMSSLRETIWIIDPKNDSNGDIIDRMKSQSKKLLKNIPHTFYYDFEQGISITDMKKRRHTLLAFKEILHNIAKHSKATQVNIYLSSKENNLTIRVQDNGVGFNPKDKAEGFGLENLKFRARHANGNVAIKSELHQGTLVEFSVKTD